MIKNFISIIFLVAVLFSMSAFQTVNPADCEVEEALKVCKKTLSPFSFQDRKTITFDYSDQSQTKEYDIQLYEGEEYRFVINRSYAPGVEIEIYNKPQEKGNRKLVYSSKTDTNNGDVLTFDPLTVPHLYIDVIIPGGTKDRAQGCVTFMVGYELVFID